MEGRKSFIYCFNYFLKHTLDALYIPIKPKDNRPILYWVMCTYTTYRRTLLHLLFATHNILIIYSPHYIYTLWIRILISSAATHTYTLFHHTQSCCLISNSSLTITLRTPSVLSLSKHLQTHTHTRRHFSVTKIIKFSSSSACFFPQFLFNT